MTMRPIHTSAPPYTAPDLAHIPLPIRILVDKLAEATEGGRLDLRDRIQRLVLSQSNGPIAIRDARALNTVLASYGLAPIAAHEHARIAPLPEMVAEHISVTTRATPSGHVAMSAEELAHRAAIVEGALRHIEARGVAFDGPADPEELVSARMILAMAIGHDI